MQLVQGLKVRATVILTLYSKVRGKAKTRQASGVLQFLLRQAAAVWA